MGSLIEELQAVVVRAALDLSELEESYRDGEGEGLRLEFRLNWTRAQKDRQRALQEETLQIQQQYVALKDLTEDRKAWEKARETANQASEDNWRAWTAWWAEILLMTPEETLALADALPEQHWVWVTTQVSTRAREYEDAAVKKAVGGRSRSTEGRDT